MYRNIGIQGNNVTSFECSISLFCDNFCIFLGCCDINIQTKEVQQQKMISQFEMKILTCKRMFDILSLWIKMKKWNI